jgi:glutamine synthetase
MNPRAVTTAAEARALIAERGLSHVQIGVFDLNGILRAKHVAVAKLLAALDQSLAFGEVVLGWDVNDQLCDNLTFTGWHTGYGDARLRVVPDGCRALPWDPGGLFFLCEFMPPAETFCPRGVLRRQVERARSLGFEAFAGIEFEMYVFEESPDSVRAKGYRNLKTLAPGYFGYTLLRSAVQHDFYRKLLALCEIADLPLECLHQETGPGALEASLAYDSAIRAADKAALFKTFAKVVAQRDGKMASFMARWSREWAGVGGHIHLSLRHSDGTGAFHDAAAEHQLSRTMLHFIGGLQALLPEILVLIAPYVNSYRRLSREALICTDATWGIDNRNCAIRAIPGPPLAQRLEFRTPGADANPYLSLAAALAAGLYGIERELLPSAAVVGNAYEQKFPDAMRLPATLHDAASRFRESPAAREMFGREFVEHFAATCEWEEREFRKAVTDWEVARYFEIV